MRGSDNEIDVPPPPREYLLLQYRRKMNISYPDLLATPWHVISKDIEMMNLEQEFKPEQPQPEEQ